MTTGSDTSISCQSSWCGRGRSSTRRRSSGVGRNGQKWQETSTTSSSDSTPSAPTASGSPPSTRSATVTLVSRQSTAARHLLVRGTSFISMPSFSPPRSLSLYFHTFVFHPSFLPPCFLLVPTLLHSSLFLPSLFTQFLISSPWFPAPSKNPTGVRSESTDTDTLLITWDVSNI